MTHVFIVEDQAMVRKLLESYVEKEPDLALAASIPGADLTPELCGQQQVNLILMDVQTENRENGLTAAAQIKREHRQIKFVIVTSPIDAEVLRQAIRWAGIACGTRTAVRNDRWISRAGRWQGSTSFPTRRRSCRFARRRAPSSRMQRCACFAVWCRACLIQPRHRPSAWTPGRSNSTSVIWLQKTNFENKLQLAVAAIETRLTANVPEE